jgi:hypothetical protein
LYHEHNQAEVGMGKTALLRHGRQAVSRETLSSLVLSRHAALGVAQAAAVADEAYCAAEAQAAAEAAASGDPNATPRSVRASSVAEEKTQALRQEVREALRLPQTVRETRKGNSAARAPPIVQAKCAAMDQLQPLLVLSDIIRQVSCCAVLFTYYLVRA